MVGSGKTVRRLVSGAGGLVLADLVVGLTASSSIMLGGLWICSVQWLRAAFDFSAQGSVFGADWQLGLACLGAVATVPALGITLYLAREALRLPARLLRTAAR